MNEITMDQLLRTVVAYKASDLHLVAGSEPQVRIDGKLIPMRVDKFDGTRIQALVYSILTDGQKQRFEENKELDFAFVLAGVGRFRGNVYMQRGSVAAAFRIIPEKTPSIDDLKMPPVIKELVKRERGLILVTGPTGSGKSTTLAAMINEINETEHKHIITIEDPVEFYHNHKNSLVSQRTVGEDTKSFAAALKYALREDPDVILIGEMRDIETIRAALTAAETGHLVFGTLHTNSAIKTINRIINVFPEEEQALVRTQLSLNLTAVIAQALLPKIEGGRIAALEILI
ncbi:MAG: PilT/PilU family type 4a pilus ATPase, partial [Campylobacterales bacterium]